MPDQEPAYAVIGEMSGLLRDTRYGLLTCGGLLGAVMIGLALEAGPSARALRPSVVGVLALAVLCGLFASALIAVSVLSWASRPVLSTLTELRWVTGAPPDTRPHWLTVPPPGTDAEAWTWTRAHLHGRLLPGLDRDHNSRTVIRPANRGRPGPRILPGSLSITCGYRIVRSATITRLSLYKAFQR
jgi:hypothetical protein